MSEMMIISADGHATARMQDYRPYVDPEFRNDFDAFLGEWESHGVHSSDLKALAKRIDPPQLAEWDELMVSSGRLRGNWDPAARLSEMESQGVVAEVVFPDFGIPFELYSPLAATVVGHTPPPASHLEAGQRAYNRWIAAFRDHAPERFACMGLVSWRDTDAAVEELYRCKEMGIAGVVLPKFSPSRPLYSPEFDCVWEVLEELDLIVNIHVAMSSTSDKISTPGTVPHPALTGRVWVPEMMFFAQNTLNHIIWGGVAERFPSLRFVITELGSGWIAGALRDMDYTYEGSYYRTDMREFLSKKPSEYFANQFHIGASTFSREEIAMRDLIGVEKMMFGMDYPHHEGTMIGGTLNYLRATYGAAEVDEDEARIMLGLTAAGLFGFDKDALEPIVKRVGVQPADVLAPPNEDLYPLGDVKKPSPLFIRGGGTNPGRSLVSTS